MEIVFDLSGLNIPDAMNDQGFGGNAYLDLITYVEYEWQLNTSDYRFINKPFVIYMMTNIDGSLFDSIIFYMTEDTSTPLSMNSLMASCINEFNVRYGEMTRSTATDDDNSIQDIDNLVNQQKAAIEESNRYLCDIDEFMRLLKNLRGNITQIVKRHAKVDIDNTEQATASSEGIYYLNANNLYGGAMHRMMPYELVGVPERREVMEKINRDPNGWV